MCEIENLFSKLSFNIVDSSIDEQIYNSDAFLKFSKFRTDILNIAEELELFDNIKKERKTFTELNLKTATTYKKVQWFVNLFCFIQTCEEQQIFVVCKLKETFCRMSKLAELFEEITFYYDRENVWFEVVSLKKYLFERKI